MPIYLDPHYMRAVIMEHYEHPHNKRTPSEDYENIHLHTASCVDDIHVFLKVIDDKIHDIAFNGIGCAISTSSTSLMTDLLMGKTITEGLKIIDEFLKMIHEETYDEKVLGDAIALANVSKQASRIKCATIGWNGAKVLLEKRKHAG